MGVFGRLHLLFVCAIIQEPELFRAAARVGVGSLVELSRKRKLATAVWAHALTCDLFKQV
ncbi:MAG: hypothetical protein ACR2JC_20445 [Chloroflexota bacterium]|nr:MAG: hypothetical protein DLM70_13220 [Chloroflexota bacterium]